jgi:hypothetical protein
MHGHAVDGETSRLFLHYVAGDLDHPLDKVPASGLGEAEQDDVPSPRGAKAVDEPIDEHRVTGQERGRHGDRRELRHPEGKRTDREKQGPGDVD